MQYIFFLGNSPTLAFTELSSVLGRFKKSSPQQFDQAHLLNMASVQSDLGEERMIEIAQELGGTVKVATVFAEVENSDSGIIISKITEELEKSALKSKLNKITFGISQYTTPSERIDISMLSKKLKNEINPEFKVRFVLPKFPATELSSVVIKKQLVTDISIIVTSDKTYCLKTIWIQDFEDWGKRDYGRPAAEGHIGMLPPKVARMMVNLSLPTATNSEPITILDPFCGVGTILAEALILGHSAKGSDADIAQVRRTKANLGWLSEAYELRNTKYQILQCDARNLKEFFKEKVDAIVTEPDLGPNNPNLQQSWEISIKLQNLYLSSLQSWKELLKPGGKIVIALPSFASTNNISNSNNTNLVKTVIDKAKIMGYSIKNNPIQYARPQARVIRNICIFVNEN